MDDDAPTFGGMLPKGMTWCPNCNGYGSSLSEGSGRCSQCAGTGLIPLGQGTQPRSAIPSKSRNDASA